MSELFYGTSRAKKDTFSTVTKKDDTTSATNFENLSPGTRYYYTITSYEAATPDKKASYEGAFTTRGYPVIVYITSNKKESANAQLAVDGQTYKANNNGMVKLELSDKTYDATITLLDATIKKVSIPVMKKTIPTNNTEPESQVFRFDVASAQTGSSTTNLSSLIGPLVIGAVAVALIGGGGIFFLIYRRRKLEQTVSPLPVSTDYLWQTKPSVHDSYTETPASQFEQPIPAKMNPDEQEYTAVTSVEQKPVSDETGQEYNDDLNTTDGIKGVNNTTNISEPEMPDMWDAPQQQIEVNTVTPQILQTPNALPQLTENNTTSTTLSAESVPNGNYQYDSDQAEISIAHPLKTQSTEDGIEGKLA
ncbi:hypothetical protein A2707_05225 [Candidatus Saccharibacteria bacterium RIFCSPHIGHO2_01_FULL_45_15]|nr:MAG: hypothetical protein A2707_05225 [Candidatus Saccharibacteria bacterium RIFCSPHIGHO2_01_FULL_45_15]OGL27418.1 MAG: hypothetical protein A3C39_05265 [Candidatus Saccharibacteria bacterium RIFCSPHIGHO2_02_FULL_46_12]OGL32634.1 MAG: hypothetical protein A3E76_04740 [Candidatus Saccharibacteria bacterium RIFCSPHIGHO2_12_FULL_44_22]